MIERSKALNTIASDCAAIVHRIREINQLAQQHGLELAAPPEKPFLDLISKAAILKHTPPAVAGAQHPGNINCGADRP